MERSYCICGRDDPTGPHLEHTGNRCRLCSCEDVTEVEWREEEKSPYCEDENAYTCPTCGNHNETSICIVDHRLDALRGPDHQCYRDHKWRLVSPPSPAPVTDAALRELDRVTTNYLSGLPMDADDLRQVCVTAFDMIADHAHNQARIGEARALGDRQLDAVDAALPPWKGTGRGRIDTINNLQERVGTLEDKLQSAMQSIHAERGRVPPDECWEDGCCKSYRAVLPAQRGGRLAQEVPDD